MLFLFLVTCILGRSLADIKSSDFHYRAEAGARTCFYEEGGAGQMLEVYYQVVDGQRGQMDISLEVLDPNGTVIAADHEKPQNAIIKDLTADGVYAICLDNTHSFNSKLVFVYVTFESEESDEAVVTVIDSEGKEMQVEALTWMFEEEDEPYYLEVDAMTKSLTRTLKYVVRARHMLDVYSASKSRDSHLAFRDTFVVDTWSGFQITLMFLVGMVQVYMIKKLFKTPCYR